MFTPHRHTSRVSEDVLDSLKHKLIRKSLQLACLGLVGSRHWRLSVAAPDLVLRKFRWSHGGCGQTERSRVSLWCARLEIGHYTTVGYTSP